MFKQYLVFFSLIITSFNCFAFSYIPKSIVTDVSFTEADLVTIGGVVAVLTAIAWGLKSLRKIL